tara:strand:- start:491 stop:985 length:495 start_codon:yes stop_codon:yes gene_type:complete
MAFKMKGFSPFTAKTADMEVAGIERKQARIDRKAAKGKDVSRKQDRLDKESERIYDREIARAERKERKADKKYEKGRTKAGDRKTRKADKIREAASPLAKKSAYKKDKKVPRIPGKSPHDVVQMLEKKKANGTITAAELKRLNAIKTRMEKGPGSYGNEQWDKE